jgi:hypothetical protein
MKMKEKNLRKKARLEICAFFGQKEIRKFVYPHSSFTRGRVKYGLQNDKCPQFRFFSFMAHHQLQQQNTNKNNNNIL